MIKTLSSQWRSRIDQSSLDEARRVRWIGQLLPSPEDQQGVGNAIDYPFIFFQQTGKDERTQDAHM
jgi:hypothetical protein